MALTTPRGFAGGPMADIDYGIGAAGGPWVETGPALAVTQPSSGVRAVSLAAGTACAYGIRVTNDAPLSQAVPAPSSGGAWYVVALRFNWSSKTVTLQLLPGPTTGATTAPSTIPAALPGTITSNPGASFDMVLAWVFVQSATATATIFDTRMGRSGQQDVAIGNAALAVVALQTPPLLGTEVPSLSDGTTYRWTGISWQAQFGGAWTPNLGGGGGQSLGDGGIAGGTWGQVGRTVTIAGHLGFGSGATMGGNPAIIGDFPVNVEDLTTSGTGWIRHQATGALIPIMLFPVAAYAASIQIIGNGGTTAATQASLPVVQQDTCAFSVVGVRA